MVICGSFATRAWRHHSVKLLARRYHDESFGFRKARAFDMPDYTPAQLENRAKNSALLRYVDSMRIHGHRAAQVDPLGILQREEVAALDPLRYGLSHDSAYDISGIVWNRGTDSVSAEAVGGQHWTLKEIESHLRRTYVGRIAYEFMHSPSKTERLWFSHLLESSDTPLATVGPRDQKRIHDLLVQSETLDQFLQLKFPNTKRYGLEGGESMIPALDALFDTAAGSGVRHVVLGMPHRGRLNLLVNLLQFPAAGLFHKIRGGSEIPDGLGATGDVLSHLVSSPTLQYNGNNVKVSLLPNPSHLEAINPVVLGKVRSKQYALLNESPSDCMLGDRVMSVQLHGDAAFTGQGVTMECLGLSNLPHFTCGGTVHLVVNIGYTTPGTSGRSSLYCSDVAKMINAPVLHCNGDHPLNKTENMQLISIADVVRAIQIALHYRNHFRKDIVVDLMVYRRWGHNELDDPSFTGPLMYNNIRSRKSSAGILTDQQVATIRGAARDGLEAELAATPNYTPPANMLQNQWAPFVWPMSNAAQHNPDTGVDSEHLKAVGNASVTLPADFHIHHRLQRHTKNRLTSLETGQKLDWATGEALAFGTLMKQGYNVRISGQDCGRGTFSNRHAMFVDQETERVTVPLNDNDKQSGDGMLELANSSLSEFAVMGFEYGMSWDNPHLLPIWEAQFGDFFNGSQIIIDTFITSAETKWLKQSGLTILLPHGLDGAGPEHSSARIERWLQLTNDAYEHSADNQGSINMTVVNPTTPAQFFHLLRRQMLRNYRKPLIVASPKGLLRAPEASSPLSDFEPGTSFQSVIPDSGSHNASHVLLVSGKIYYELVKERAARGLTDRLALVRVEQLSPFPFAELSEIVKQYGSEVQFRWVQEEARNQGAWTHVEPRIHSAFEMAGGDRKLRYVGRKESAVPGVSGALHKQQSSALLEEAFAGM
ncbi:dehydrogenase E1 and transketolase domain-containing protein 1 [Auriculariales sp. MPI-PUGE-AT-0066]|nr:dehydrogenase E1 and transketolase domain-containing protein 1 [Auriculariales sp. MPI-PUGE-AT-0066]